MPTRNEISIRAWPLPPLPGSQDEWMVSIHLDGKDFAAMTLPVEAPEGVAAQSNLISFLRDLATMIQDDLEADIGEPAGKRN
jgi:hypothetical protein